MNLETAKKIFAGHMAELANLIQPADVRTEDLHDLLQILLRYSEPRGQHLHEPNNKITNSGA